jgi:hypothetical protein
LDVPDYQPETAELRVRHGKRPKARLAYATNGTKARDRNREPRTENLDRVG